MGNMEIRNHEFEVRLEAETRTVSGIAVPYGQTIDLGGYQERVARGAFDTTKKVPLFFGHEHRSIPIGKVVAMRDTEKGLEIDAKLNDTSQANDVYAALRAGDLNKFSIGFIPVESRDENGVTVRVRADLKEVSVVTFPAYSGAEVSMVREDTTNNIKENKMHENDFSNDVAELRDSVADLERKFDRISEERAATPATSVCKYTNGGEWLKSLYRHEPEAQAILTRDFGTTVEADVTRPAFVGGSLELIHRKRVIKNAFASQPLPASGLEIEYVRVKSQTGAVASVTEGANLPYLEVALENAKADVVRYGGYSSISRLAIERSDVNYLDSVLRNLAGQYADATDLAVQTALLATFNTVVSASTANKVELEGTGTTAVHWLGAVLDAKAAIDDNSRNLTADVIIVSRDVWKTLALITDTAGRPVFAVNGDGANTFGNTPLNGRMVGSIDGTPVIVGKHLPADTVIVASRDALVTYENSGAPFSLADQNIVNLTQDFSLYGDMAIAIPDVKGITFIVDEAA